MGYMGFGLQRWIYTQEPRKFFKKRKRTTGDTDSRRAYGPDYTDYVVDYRYYYSKDQKEIHENKLNPYPVKFFLKNAIIPAAIVALIAVAVVVIYLY